MRDAAINLRALPEQRELIDQAASALSKTRSDFMLEAACERAQSVLLNEVFFRVDADKFDQFMAQLDAPPKPNPGSGTANGRQSASGCQLGMNFKLAPPQPLTAAHRLEGFFVESFR